MKKFNYAAEVAAQLVAEGIEAEAREVVKNGHAVGAVLIPHVANGIRADATIYFSDDEEVSFSLRKVKEIREKIDSGKMTMPFGEDVKERINNKQYVLANVYPFLEPYPEVEDDDEMSDDLSYFFPGVESGKVRVVFKAYVSESASVRLTSNHAQIIGVTKEEIRQAAMKNVETQFKVESLAEIYSRSMGIPVEVIRETMPDSPIICGEKCGAASLLAFEKVKDAAKVSGIDDFIIIPSSVNELMIIPAVIGGEKMDDEYAANMVREVNSDRSVIYEEEVLVDGVFVYRNGNLGFIAA